MQIMSVRGTMISRVSVSESLSTLRSISEVSGSKSLASTSRSIMALPCSICSFSSSSSSESSDSRLRFWPFWPPTRANGVRAEATVITPACLIMMSTGFSAPTARGRTSTDTTATISANSTPHTSSSHSGAPHSDAMHITSTPSSTLQEMRKNMHDPEVAYRSAISFCTLWMRSMRFMRVNWLIS